MSWLLIILLLPNCLLILENLTKHKNPNPLAPQSEDAQDIDGAQAKTSNTQPLINAKEAEVGNRVVKDSTTDGTLSNPSNDLDTPKKLSGDDLVIVRIRDHMMKKDPN